jgi:hypothetical protein
MALVVKDRVQETSTTTGTGTLTLSGALAGFQSFSVIGNGNTTYYTIAGNGEWEVGIGTYTASGTTLSRDTILESSNGGTAVNFSAGIKNVFVTYPAEKSVDTETPQTITNKTISGASNTITNLSLTTGVTGVLPQANGGTGTTVGYNGFKNRLINAQGLINQRAYVSGTATSGANQYTVDRWRVVTSGQNLTFSTSANVVTFTAPAGGVEQVIEGLNLETATYVLSWTGTATATVAGSSVANGGTVSITGGTNTTVRFTNGTFSLPQLEKGSNATSFDYRPFATELSLCQRYFQRYSYIVDFHGSGLGVSTYTPVVAIVLPVPMRATPTVTTSNFVILAGNTTASEFASGWNAAIVTTYVLKGANAWGSGSNTYTYTINANIEL